MTFLTMCWEPAWELVLINCWCSAAMRKTDLLEAGGDFFRAPSSYQRTRKAAGKTQDVKT
ncbi:MAG: hypothetical protein J6N21_18670 [Butyrivibrio sp.]|nr:hypothetical protein [Butyrivibrio sp.]